MKQIVLLLVAIVISFFIGCSKQEKNTYSPTPIDTLSILVTIVQQKAKLYTSEYLVSKIITHKDTIKADVSFFRQNTVLDMSPLGVRRVAIPINVTLKAFIDFEAFDSKNILREQNKINIILPDPQIEITSSKVDHQNTKEYVPLLRSKFSDEELSSYILQGRKQIEGLIPQMGIVENARENSARQLIPIIKSLGYKEENITITFRKDFKNKDIKIGFSNQEQKQWRR